SQAIHDPQLRASAKGRVSERLEAAKSFTLTDYTNKIALPTWTRRAGLQSDSERLRTGGSLAAILDRVRSNQKVFIMHNADDTLTQGESSEGARAARGVAMPPPPPGGPLGTLCSQETREAIVALSTPPAASESTR